MSKRLVSINNVILVIALIVSVRRSFADESHSTQMDRYYVNWACYMPCADDCVEKYGECGPKKFLHHCFEVCLLLCNYEPPKEKIPTITLV